MNLTLALILSDSIQRKGVQTLLDELFPEVGYHILNPAALPTVVEQNICITDMINYISEQGFFSSFGGRCAILTSGMQPMGITVGAARLINSSNNLEQIIDDLSDLIYHNDPPKDELTECSEEISSREMQVLTLVVSGAINKEIAAQLNISINTVLTHRKNITSKLGIKTVSGLTLYALMHGYIKG